ncbi:Gfo/Idh/MocA family protein [Microlunatus soli]|uniref:Gfo/Idh/MocA family protein n=1 Tax=Microlunatus soli TaxID=630515 RepID=UPI0012FC9FAF|nr:Gfo/Idh/MocA family oxidoreductase [Microlunatus soli]
MTETQDKRIRWGIISTGHIAGVFARDLALLPDEAELAAVASRTQDKADAFAAEHGFARSYGSYAELAADDAIDAVYIATPHNDHVGSARMCLEAGKSVLVEKPLTTSAADTESLIGLARERGLFLMEALWTRTNPLLRKAVEVAHSGELGPIRHLDVSFGFRFSGPDDHRLIDPAQAGGAIWDLGVYPTHLSNVFLGEPTDLVGFGHRTHTGVDSHAAATLRFAADGDRPEITASLLASLEIDPTNRATVFCEQGKIELDSVVKPESITVVRGTGGDAEREEIVTQLLGGGYTLQAQEVMLGVRSGKLESPLVPWADSLAVARTLDRWLETVTDEVPAKPAGSATSGSGRSDFAQSASDRSGSER